MKESYFFETQLAYTLTYEAGKKKNRNIVNQYLYDKLIEFQLPLGQKLFMENCASCHNANTDMVGPKLKGVANIRAEDWLIKMITNSEQLIKSGDKDAIELYNKWNKSEHPNFEILEPEEIKSIIDFIKRL